MAFVDVNDRQLLDVSIEREIRFNLPFYYNLTTVIDH